MYTHGILKAVSWCWSPISTQKPSSANSHPRTMCGAASRTGAFLILLGCSTRGGPPGQSLLILIRLWHSPQASPPGCWLSHPSQIPATMPGSHWCLWWEYLPLPDWGQTPCSGPPWLPSGSQNCLRTESFGKGKGGAGLFFFFSLNCIFLTMCPPEYNQQASNELVFLACPASLPLPLMACPDVCSGGIPSYALSICVPGKTDCTLALGMGVWVSPGQLTTFSWP